MKKYIILLTIANSFAIVNAQNESVEKVQQLEKKLKQTESEVSTLNSSVYSLKSDIKDLKNEIKQEKQKSDSLSNLHQQLKSDITTSFTKVEGNINQTKQEAKNDIATVNELVSKSQLYWIIAVLVLLSLSGIVYFLLKKKITKSNVDVLEQIKNTQQKIEEETLKTDSKLIELLEQKIQVQEIENANKPEVEKDHSFALKVADEIVRMQKNISRMDESVKGLKPLEKGLERMQNNFKAQGYELSNLLGKPYDVRMNVDVISFVEDDNLSENSKIISKVLRPEIIYNNKLIQRAQVEVSQN